MLTLISGAIALATISNPDPVGPECQSPPSGSSNAVIACYNIACANYRAAWHECSTKECRIEALVNYLITLNLCGPTNQISESGWITIWVNDSEYGFTYDNTIPEGATAFEF